jgi:hypothetical protein
MNKSAKNKLKTELKTELLSYLFKICQDEEKKNIINSIQIPDDKYEDLYLDSDLNNPIKENPLKTFLSPDIEKEYDNYGKFNIDYTLTYTRQQYDVASNGAYWEVFNTAQNVPLTSYRDWRNYTFASPNHYYNDYYNNPYFVKDNARSTGTSHDLIGSATLSYKILPWLTATYRAGTTINSSYNRSTSGAFTYSPFARTSGKYNSVNDIFASVSDGQGIGTRLTSEAFLSGQKEFGKFEVDALLGQSYRETYSKSTGVSGSNLIIPTLFNISNRKKKQMSI